MNKFMKYALVTGGSRGIGRAICLKLAAMGMPVIINYQSNREAAEEAKRLVEEQGGTAELLPFNVAVPEEIEAALDDSNVGRFAGYLEKLTKNTQFIVMSAYDKFDYAKEAINLGVLEYLNKPFNQKSIVAVVNQAIAVLDERRAKRSQDLENKEKLETVVPIIENGFISSVLFHETYDEELDNYKNLLGLSVSSGFMLAVIFGENEQNGHMTNVVGTSVKAQTKFYSKVREIIKEYFPKLMRVCLLRRTPPL